MRTHKNRKTTFKIISSSPSLSLRHHRHHRNHCHHYHHFYHHHHYRHYHHHYYLLLFTGYYLPFNIYKITKIVRALWLAERSVCMRVCKHGCGVKMFCFSRVNHGSTNFKKFSSSKLDKFTLFAHSFVGWNLENRYKEGVSIFFSLKLTFEAGKVRILESIFLQNKNWLRVQDFVDKTLRLVRISLLISTITKSFAFFLGKLFYKSNRKLFSRVWIAWYKHSRRWENSRRLCKPSTSSRVCITVSHSPNPSRVYIRLCKHGKRFLLLKYYIIYILFKTYMCPRFSSWKILCSLTLIISNL